MINIFDSNKNKIKSELYPCPVGFVYIQFPNQKAPYELFEGQWIEITSDYDSCFLRIEGSQSLPFGQIQNEGLPNITGRDALGWYGEYLGEVVNNHYSKQGALKGLQYTVKELLGEENPSPTWRVSSENYLILEEDTSLGIGFDASLSNSIYGASQHVTPLNIAIKLWIRES